MMKKTLQQMLDEIEDLPETMTGTQISRSGKLKDYSNREEVALRRSKTLSEMRQTSEFNDALTTALREACGTTEARARNRAAQRKAWSDEDRRDAQRQRQKEVQNRPDVKATVSAAVKQAMQRPEVKEKVSSRTTEAMARPEVKAKMRKPRAESTCPHCGFTGRGGIMKRWHFDNCKHNPRGRPRKLVPVMADGRPLTTAVRATRRIDNAIQLLLNTYKTKEAVIAAIIAYEEFTEA